jgi:Ca2+-binding EF-hand superfamily protein
MFKKDLSLSSMSLSEAEQNFIFANYLTKDKIDELKESFLRRREQEGSPKDTVSFHGALSVLMEAGRFISDDRKFDLVGRFEGKSNVDFKDLLKMMCFVALNEERKENSETNFEFIDAYGALGGSKDGTGHITIQQLERALEDFGLTIDVPAILETFDIGETNISYESFCKIFDRSIMEESKSVTSEPEVR